MKNNNPNAYNNIRRAFYARVKEKEKNDHSKCKNCGAQNLLHASFCNICGQELFAHKKVVTKNCSCCGAQINGLQGQVVKCNYCDSKTTI